MTIVRVYYAVHRGLEAFTKLLAVANNGFWLGILSREQLHAIGQHNYEQAGLYFTDEYNKRGLWDWERQVLERDFAGCKKLLLASAGGGREVLALRKQGLEVAGFEPDRGLLEFANGLMEREGLEPDLRWAAWDRCPDIDGQYDGVIVGWGGYMLIRGRENRIRFLKALRERVVEGAPILLSFNTAAGERSRVFRGVALIGNLFARVLRRERVEVGDMLTPNFEHFFTREQVESEMIEAGFTPIFFDKFRFGHSVGRAA